MENLLFKLITEDKHEILKEDINIQLLLNDLYSLQILSKHDFEVIESKPTAADKWEYVLQILTNGNQYDGNNHYKEFIDIIKKHYPWVYDKYKELISSDKWKDDRFNVALHYGDFPRKPAHYINRLDKLIQVKDALQKLELGGKIVLHGMTGCGKSSLAVGVMDVDLVLETFDTKVFWINAGNPDDEKILRIMYRLYHKLGPHNASFYHENNINSIDDMQVLLKDRIFKENPHNKRMLLILDNVSNQEVVDAFDVGCKILITTQNKDIVKAEEGTHFFEVIGTFKKEESLALFAKCLNKPEAFVRNIPQASQIHDLCKGHPMNIALFGSQMVTYREELLNGKRWDYFVKILEKKEYFDTQTSTIKSCLDSLEINLRNKYEDFCVFAEDVNISSNVLETLWNLGNADVSNIMTQLENKSLIVSYYSNYHNTYIYGIHVVLLDYLKRSASVNKVERHRKLITAYDRISNSNYAKLPNDNYIFQYIGYHLQHAGLYERFTKIYFDLNFLGAKIRATGIGDLLKDFKIYEKEIIGDYRIQENKHILNELKNFVKTYGQDLYKYPNTSIIQCGLKQAKDSYVYKTALGIAKEDESALYFKVQPSQQSYCGSFPLPKDTSFACFAKYENDLLIGTVNGDVQLWEQTYTRTLCKFSGHNSKIIYLEVNQDRDKFLSLSEDGTMRLWNLDDVLLRHNFSNEDQRIPSPYLKQSGYKNFFGDELTIKQSNLFAAANDDKLTCAAFADDYNNLDFIVTGSVNGSVIIWKGQVIDRVHNIFLSVDFIKFSSDDLLVVASAGKELFLLDVNSEQRLSKSCLSNVRSILIARDDAFVTLHDTIVSLWTFEGRKMPGKVIPNIHETVMYKISGTNFICAAVYDEEYLYVSSNDNCVRMFDLKSKNLMETYSEKAGSVVSIDVLLTSQREFNFLYRFESNVATIWEIKPWNDDKLKTKYLPVFSCFWPENAHGSSAKPRLALVNCEKQIQVMNGFNLLNETDVVDCPIKAICFSRCGNKIAYGLESGRIWEYEIKTRQCQNLMDLQSPVTYLKYFYGNLDALELQGECNGLLVASGENGKIMVNCSGRSHCLISPSNISKISIRPIVQCFFIQGAQTLLTISDNRAVKVWYLNNGSMVVLKAEKVTTDNFVVTVAAMKMDLLAVGMSDSTFEIYRLVTEDVQKMKMEDFAGKNLKSPIRSCCFNCDGRFLALGCDDGNIVIYNTHANRIYVTLQLHKSPVRDLVFSPGSETILVSLGEQIVWWSINKIPDSLINRRSYRKSLKSHGGGGDLSSQFAQINLQPWMNKVGPPGNPHLLRTFKLQGSYADYIATSPNFTSFVTVDDTGKLYIMELLE